MNLGDLNGKRPNVTVALYDSSPKQSTLRRYPYLTAVLIVAIASMFVFVVRCLLSFRRKRSRRRTGMIGLIFGNKENFYDLNDRNQMKPFGTT